MVAKAHQSAIESDDETSTWHERRDRRRQRQIKKQKPWLFETGRQLSEAPDISYRRRLIELDEEEIEKLRENTEMHFTERCHDYLPRDVNNECQLLRQYCEWIKRMSTEALNLNDKEKVEFYVELFNSVDEDYWTLCHEDWLAPKDRHDRCSMGGAENGGDGSTTISLPISEEPDQKGPLYDKRL